MFVSHESLSFVMARTEQSHSLLCPLGLAQCLVQSCYSMLAHKLQREDLNLGSLVPGPVL